MNCYHCGALIDPLPSPEELAAAGTSDIVQALMRVTRRTRSMQDAYTLLREEGYEIVRRPVTPP